MKQIINRLCIPMNKHLIIFQNCSPILFRLARKGVDSRLLILNTSAGNMTLMLFISFGFSGPAVESGCIVQNWIILWETRGYHRIATEDSILNRYPAMLSGKQLPTFWMIVITLSSGSNSIRQVIIMGYVRFELLMAVKLPDYTAPHIVSL